MEVDNVIAKTATATVAAVRHTGRIFALSVALIGCGAMLLLMYVWIWTAAAPAFLLHVVAELLDEVYGPEGQSMLFPPFARAPSGFWENGNGKFDFEGAGRRRGVEHKILLRVKKKEWPLSSEELRRRTLAALDMLEEAQAETQPEAQAYEKLDEQTEEQPALGPGDRQVTPGQIEKLMLDDDDDEDWAIPWPSDHPDAPHEEAARAPDDHLTVAKESNTEEREISKDGNHSLAIPSKDRAQASSSSFGSSNAVDAAKRFPVAPHEMAKRPAQQPSIAGAAIVQDPASMPTAIKQERSVTSMGSNNGRIAAIAMPMPSPAASPAQGVPGTLQNPSAPSGKVSTQPAAVPNFSGRPQAWITWSGQQSSKAMSPANFQQPEIQRPATGWAAAAAKPPASGPEPWNSAPIEPAKTTAQPKPEFIPPHPRTREPPAQKAPAAPASPPQKSGEGWSEGPRLRRPSAAADSDVEAAEPSRRRPQISYAPSTSATEFLPSLKGDLRALAEARAIRLSHAPPRDRKKHPSQTPSRPPQRLAFAALLNKPQVVVPAPPTTPPRPKIQHSNEYPPPHRRAALQERSEAEAEGQAKRITNLTAEEPGDGSSGAEKMEPGEDLVVEDAERSPSSNVQENVSSPTDSLLDESIPSLSDDMNPRDLMAASKAMESEQQVRERRTTLAAAVTDLLPSPDRDVGTDTAHSSGGYQHADLALLDDMEHWTPAPPPVTESAPLQECMGDSDDGATTSSELPSRSCSPETVRASPSVHAHGSQSPPPSTVDSEAAHPTPSLEHHIPSEASGNDGDAPTGANTNETIMDPRAALRRDLINKSRTAFSALQDAVHKGHDDAKGRMRLQRNIAFYKKRRGAFMKAFPENELLRTELVGEEELVAKCTAKA